MLKPGDRVVRNGLYDVPEEDRDRVYTVTSVPRTLDNGVMVAALDGMADSVPVDGLSLLLDDGAPPAPSGVRGNDDAADRH